jgi:predicted transcriptional regulator
MSGSQKVPVTISMDSTQLARLDQIAADLDRSRSWVASRALGAFLAVTDSPSLHLDGSPAGEAEPPSTGGRHTPVLGLDHSTEQPMDNPPAAQPHGLHLAHLTRVGEASRRQTAETQAGRDAALARSSEYIANLAKPE